VVLIHSIIRIAGDPGNGVLEVGGGNEQSPYPRHIAKENFRPQQTEGQAYREHHQSLPYFADQRRLFVYLPHTGSEPTVFEGTAETAEDAETNLLSGKEEQMIKRFL
jgi:hypothetical protein